MTYQLPGEIQERGCLRRSTHLCLACPLGGTGPRSDGFGPAAAQVAVLGVNPSSRAPPLTLGAFLAPYLAAAPELRGVIPGAARAFAAIAWAAGVPLGLLYSSNVVKCATPSNRPPSRLEVETCRRMHLDLELGELADLRLVLVLGRAAGAPLGLSDFGQRARVEGTLAEAVLMRHPVATLRRWTQVNSEAMRWREVLGGTIPLAPPGPP